MEDGICYVNGSFVPATEAKVSIFDRGFTSGEGVYDVTRSFGHKLFKLTVPDSIADGSKARIEARVHSEAGDDHRVVSLDMP